MDPRRLCAGLFPEFQEVQGRAAAGQYHNHNAADDKGQGAAGPFGIRRGGRGGGGNRGTGRFGCSGTCRLRGGCFGEIAGDSGVGGIILRGLGGRLGLCDRRFGSAAADLFQL